jgi:hypothetical protein
MNTERLIDLLSTNVEPVDRQTLNKSLAVAIVVGIATAICLMLATVSVRADLGSSVAFVALKLGFALTLVAAGVVFLSKAIRPGQETRTPFRFAFLPLVALGTAALADLAIGVNTRPHPMTAGTHWLLCLYCIPLFAVIPFTLLIWTLRGGAPTKLRRSGAIAGLVAGAIGAAAYALHCPDDSLPFIAAWYGASIAFCSGVGALVGPRVLRW